MNNQTFVFTGTMPTLSRDFARSMVAAYGGRVAGSVCRGTSYLVAGSDAGSKVEKALSLGVPVIDQERFIAVMRGAS